MPITPHGGELVHRILGEEAAVAARGKAADLPKIAVDTYAAFDIDGIAKGKKTCPDFKDALATQYVCDAILSSAKNNKWETIKRQV